MPHESNQEHLVRVARVRQKLLDLLASVEDDPAIFPGGLPEDPEEQLKLTTLLNADALGGVLACTYMGLRNHYSEEHAHQWLAELLQILVKTVQRDRPEDKFDWKKLGEIADKLWDFSDQVPDALPEDF